MKKIIIITVSVACLLSISGCNAGGQKFSETTTFIKNSESAIIVYRPNSLVAAALYPHIYLNEKKTSPLKNGGFIVYNVSPGEHLVEAQGSALDIGVFHKRRSVRININKGETSYIRLSPTLTGFAGQTATFKSYFAEIPEKIALSELENLRLSK